MGISESVRATVCVGGLVMRIIFGKKSVATNAEKPLKGFDEKLNRRAEVISLINKLTVEKEQIEEELKDFMGEAEIAQNDKYYISYKPVTINRIDTKLLKEEQPEIYKKYQKENCSRRLMIKFA